MFSVWGVNLVEVDIIVLGFSFSLGELRFCFGASGRFFVSCFLGFFLGTCRFFEGRSWEEFIV